MIRDPVNDTECLGQLTKIARELAPTTLIQTVARRLGSREAVIRWIRSLPQADDDGHERVRYIVCDVPQRVRLLPDDPNCVERAMGAMMLLEVVDSSTPRALATVDRPMRHTGLVELRSGHWHAVDLFPRRNGRRNFDVGEFGKDVLQGVHSYVGKPILSFYGLGGVADQLGDVENKAIGRDQKKPEVKGAEKKDQPPSRKTNSDDARKPAPQRLSLATIGRALGTGANNATTPTNGGGKDGQEEKEGDHGGASASARPGAARAEADEGDGGDPHDPGATPQRWWFTLG